MTNLELEALRRQVEEDYKMDIAAIERLQRRFNTGGGNGSKGAATAERGGERQAAAAETNVVALPQGHEPRESREPRGQQAAPDELTESLRSMFSSYRK
jgi:hypothetical protein